MGESLNPIDYSADAESNIDNIILDKNPKERIALESFLTGSAGTVIYWLSSNELVGLLIALGLIIIAGSRAVTVYSPFVQCRWLIQQTQPLIQMLLTSGIYFSAVGIVQRGGISPNLILISAGLVFISLIYLSLIEGLIYKHYFILTGTWYYALAKYGEDQLDKLHDTLRKEHLHNIVESCELYAYILLKESPVSKLDNEAHTELDRFINDIKDKYTESNSTSPIKFPRLIGRVILILVPISTIIIYPFQIFGLQLWTLLFIWIAVLSLNHAVHFFYRAYGTYVMQQGGNSIRKISTIITIYSIIIIFI